MPTTWTKVNDIPVEGVIEALTTLDDFTLLEDVTEPLELLEGEDNYTDVTRP
jgi:hypothetical protein